MTEDRLFNAEPHSLRKAALFLTVPCAILFIMIAVAGIMTAVIRPMFFEYDYVLFGAVYLMYGAGVVISFRMHRNPLPLLLFLIHAGAMATYLLGYRADWLIGAAILTVMLTSVANQYFRNGNAACASCGDSSCVADQ